MSDVDHASGGAGVAEALRNDVFLAHETNYCVSLKPSVTALRRFRSTRLRRLLASNDHEPLLSLLPVFSAATVPTAGQPERSLHPSEAWAVCVRQRHSPHTRALHRLAWEIDLALPADPCRSKPIYTNSSTFARADGMSFPLGTSRTGGGPLRGNLQATFESGGFYASMIHHLSVQCTASPGK